MAALSALGNTRLPSLNPLDVRGTALPPAVLLAAKLITLAFLITGAWRLTAPFLPFIGFLGDIASPSVFQHTLQVVWLVAAAFLLVNQFPRAACLVLGGVIFVALLSSQAYRTNNLTFTALVLLLIGLSDRTTASLLLRGQFVILYFFAGTNKLLDGNWQAGGFFQTWAAIHSYGSAYLSFASHLPGRLLSAILDWIVIVTELAIAVTFVFRRLVPIGILMVIAYHSGLFLVTGSTFTMFWYALMSAALALVSWPAERPLVVYGEHERVARLAGLLRRLDLGHAFRWRREPGVGLRVESEGQIFTGQDAVARLLLFQPTLYVIFFALAAVPQHQRRWAAAVALCIAFYAAYSLLRTRLAHRKSAVAVAVEA